MLAIEDKINCPTTFHMKNEFKDDLNVFIAVDYSHNLPILEMAYKINTRARLFAWAWFFMFLLITYRNDVIAATILYACVAAQVYFMTDTQEDADEYRIIKLFRKVKYHD